jgi:hypothetical protein
VDVACITSGSFCILNSIKTSQSPIFNLFDYGFTKTEKRKIILFGGLTEDALQRSLRFRNFTSHGELWVYDLGDPSPDFFPIMWTTEAQGFSRIVSLGGEVFCIFNSNLQNDMITLDLELMISYPMRVENKIANMKRNGFALSQINGTDIMIIGGFNEYGGGVAELNPYLMTLQISFSHSIIGIDESEAPKEIFVLSAISVIIVLALIISLLYYKKKLIIEKEKADIKRDKIRLELITFNQALTKMKENREKGIPESQTKKEEMTATLSLGTDVSLAIPAYKLCDYEKDIILESLLATGGFGKVYTAFLINAILAQNYNDNIRECVIKLSHEELDPVLFFQEISIHEFFKDNKYFAKLVVYSIDPCAIILKYYPLGNLMHFLFKPKPDVVDKYNLYVAVSFSIKICTAINLMHSKGFIHNDIKPDNILLSSDSEEPLYPVISDFGLVHIKDTIHVVKGFEIFNLKGATLYYSPPEVLKAMKKGKRTSNPATDVYSIGILLWELFSRQKAWAIFDRDAVIAGALPTISVEDLSRKHPGFKTEEIGALMNIVATCLDYKPENRASLPDTIRELSKLCARLFV